MYARLVPTTSVALTTCLLFVLGCGDSHPAVDSSFTEAAVKGVVKLQGKPAEGGGVISFNPSNVERKVATVTANIGDDGSYSLTSYTGSNVVKFSGPFIKDHPELALGSRFCELSRGENVVDFDLLGANDTSNEEPAAPSYYKGGAKKKQ